MTPPLIPCGTARAVRPKRCAQPAADGDCAPHCSGTTCPPQGRSGRQVPSEAAFANPGRTRGSIQGPTGLGPIRIDVDRLERPPGRLQVTGPLQRIERPERDFPLRPPPAVDRHKTIVRGFPGSAPEAGQVLRRTRLGRRRSKEGESLFRAGVGRSPHCLSRSPSRPHTDPAASSTRIRRVRFGVRRLPASKAVHTPPAKLLFSGSKKKRVAERARRSSVEGSAHLSKGTSSWNQSRQSRTGGTSTPGPGFRLEG